MVNESNIPASAVKVTAMLQSQSDSIFYLWLAVIVFVIFIMGLLLYLYLNVWRKRHKYYVGIHVNAVAVRWVRVKKFGDRVKIKFGKLADGKPDVFTYLIDPRCVKNDLEAHRSEIQFYYHNPNPIRFDALDKNNLASIQEQNLEIILESDAIQKFVSAKNLVGTIQTLIIIILIVSGASLFGAWLNYGHVTDTCGKPVSLSYDNQTLQTIYIGSHMSSAGMQQSSSTSGGRT